MAISEAQKRATAKYHKNNYDRIELKIKKGNKQIIEEAAKKESKSLNGYIIEAVNEKLINGGNPSILDNKENNKHLTPSLENKEQKQLNENSINDMDNEDIPESIRLTQEMMKEENPLD